MSSFCFREFASIFIKEMTEFSSASIFKKQTTLIYIRIDSWVQKHLFAVEHIEQFNNIPMHQFL